MKKILKIVNIILLIIFILIATTTVSFAETETSQIIDVKKVSDEGSTSDNGKINVDNYKPSAITGVNKLTDIGNTIIGVIQLVGSIVSVIVLIVIGIQYVLGSVEEKAQYKEKMMPYIIGAILLFAITNILGVLSDIMSNIK